MNPFYPIEWMMLVILEFFIDITDSGGVSIIFLAVVINIMLLPFYNYADRLSKANSQIFAKIKPEIDKLKKNYRGKELYFYERAVYRRHNYNPIQGFKSLMGLLVQIPFFIAAYRFLADYQPLREEPFWFISDLSLPDGALGVFNVLPFLMTVANIVSAKLYIASSNSDESETGRYYLIAFVFFVMLNSESAALLLYWTCGNVFSLVKNAIALGNAEKTLAVVKSVFVKNDATINRHFLSIDVPQRQPGVFSSSRFLFPSQGLYFSLFVVALVFYLLYAEFHSKPSQWIVSDTNSYFLVLYAISQIGRASCRERVYAPV